MEVNGLYPYRVETDSGSFILFAENREHALKDLSQFLEATGEKLIYIDCATTHDLLIFDQLDKETEIPLRMDT